TARSTGMIPAAGTKLQRAAGIEESVEHFANDIFTKNHHESPPDLTMHLCRTIAGVIDWLVDVHQVNLHVPLDFKYPGHSEFRMHTPPDRTGAQLVEYLREAVKRLPSAMVAFDVNCQGLIASKDGAVVGAVVDSGKKEYVRASKVILACNGFAGNKELL